MMKPIVLCILDGVGIRNEEHGNAFAQAKKPNFDFLWNKYPHSLLEASGELVAKATKIIKENIYSSSLAFSDCSTSKFCNTGFNNLLASDI